MSNFGARWFLRFGAWQFVCLAAFASLVISPLRAAENEQAQFKRAQELEAQKNYVDAEAIYSKLIDANPVEPGLYVMRGWVRHLQKNEKEALHDLDMADMMKASQPGTLLRRGLVHRALDDFEKAAQDFRVIAAANPKDARARYELATTLSRASNHREALSALNEAIAIDPKRADYVMLRSAIHERLGEGTEALADADLALTLTTDPKQKEVIDQNRPRLAALAAEKKAVVNPGGLLPGGRPDPAKEREKAVAAAAAVAAKVEALPPEAPPPALTFNFPASIDFRRLSKAEYRAAVSAAQEQMRIVLGPQTAEENAAFEKSWANAFDFPAEPVVEYLNRLNPLLARFVSLRAAVSFTLERFNTTWEEAMTAAGYGAAAGADTLLRDARAYGVQLRTLRDDLAKVAAAIEQLGDPPDAAGIKKHRRHQADAAVQYVQDIANGEIWTQLHACDGLSLRIRGKITRRTVGNLPQWVQGTWGKFRYDSYDRTETSALSTLAGRWFSHDESLLALDSIEWVDRVFFGSGKTFSVGDGGMAARRQWVGRHDVTHEFSVCGVVSEDGRRIIDFWLVERHQESLRERGGRELYEFYAKSSGQHQSITLLHLAGSELKHFDNFDAGASAGVWFGAEVATGKPAETAAMLKSYAFNETVVITGTRDDQPLTTRETVEALGVQLTDVQFRFHPLRMLPATVNPPVFVSPQHLRDQFGEVTIHWAKIGGFDPAAEAAQAKLAKLAGFVKDVADAAALDAYKQAMAQAKKDAESKQRDIATYTKDIKSIEEYIGTIREQRARAANAIPRDDTLVKELDFSVVRQESEIQAKRDLIDSLNKGVVVHTPTPFDNMCRAQALLAAQADVDRLADIDRSRRANAALEAKLDEYDRRNFVQKTGALLDAGDGMDPKKWRALNAEAYSLVQAKLGADKNAADAETTAWERKVWAAEATVTAADFTFGLVSGSSGYRVAGLAYSFTTSALNNGLGQYYQSGSAQTGLKAGLFEGTKSVVTSLSDTADYAWNAVDAYNQDPKASFHDRMQSVVTATGSKWLMSKATGYVSAALAAKLDLTTPSTEWKPTAKQAIAAAKHQQQMEMDQALARDFLDSYKQMRTAQLRSGGNPTPELNQLAAEVRRKACSVNSSFGAKVYMKTQALPVEQRAYSRVIDEVHTELIPQFREQMAAGKDLSGHDIGKWGGHEVAPIRNASSAGTASMDFDLALRQQPNWVPDGAGGVRRNVWLTRNGEPGSPHEFQEEGQRVWDQLYRQATGYSAKTSFENITTLDHSEAYRDLAWTKITRGPNGEVRGTDAIDWRWAQQAGDVTRVKHYEMLDKQPNLDHYSKLQESCRGTAKDIKSKVSTLLDEAVKTKGSSMSADDRQHLEEVRTFWNRVQQVTSDFGAGKMPPLEAERQIYLLSGGRGLDDLTDRVGTVIERLGKGKKK